MSNADAMLWAIEDDPMLRSTIVSVFMLEQAPSRARLRYLTERVTRVVPRFRQRVVSDPLGLSTPRWRLDPDFDLDYHLRWMRLPHGGSLVDVLALAEPIGMQAFDRARPLWEWTVVEGLDGGRAALIAKIHHAVTDGVGAVNLALNLFDLEPGAPLRDMPPLEGDGGLPHRLADAREDARSAVRDSVRTAQTAARGAGALARAPRASIRNAGAAARSLARVTASGPPLSDLMTGRSLTVQFGSFELSLTDLKLAAKALGASLNDIVMAAIASGLGAYHREHGSTVDALRFIMMVNVRTPDSPAGGNEVLPMRVVLPIRDVDAGSVAVIRACALEVRAEPVVRFTKPLMGALQLIPRRATVRLVGGVQRSVDVMSSNVPGWPMPTYLAGARVEQSIGLGPLGGAAANVTVMSHVDRLSVGVTLDAQAVPDREFFITCLRAGFNQALSLTAPELVHV